MPLEALRSRRMTLEAAAKDEAEHTGAGVPGSGGRLLWFVGASFVLHGLVALVLLRGTRADTVESPGVPVAAPMAAEMIWFDGAAGVPPSRRLVASAAIGEPKSVPVARDVAYEKPPPAASAPKARPRAVPAEPVAPAADAAPAVASEQKRELPAEPSLGAAAADVAARASSEGVSGGESGLPSSEAGAPASGGGVGARSAAVPGPGGAGGAALGDLRAYARSLTAVVARQRRYPETAVRLGMQGTAHVQLRLRQDGSLVEAPRLVTSSGHDILDAEALRMVEAAAPFAPFPDSASRPDAGFVIPVVFSLRTAH
ncbi:energy transducer TonB [Hyalangium minutum]|uniref:energy transducer TonB n=1 Tax=Hyalangium minutum TaxID=394096 RepID=UPI000A076C19